MGMFDHIICKSPLPLNEELRNLDVKWDEIPFQTKDLDNCLANYSIEENGELLEEFKKYKYTYYTEEEKKQKGHNRWEIVKSSELIDSYTKKIEFHGVIEFYHLFPFSETEDIWVAFNAFFNYGKLDRITLSRAEKREAQSIRFNKWIEEDEKRKKTFYYRLRKYSGWFWLWFNVSRFFYNLSGVFSKLHLFALQRVRDYD